MWRGKAGRGVARRGSARLGGARYGEVGQGEAMLKRRVCIMLCFCDGVLHRTKQFVPDYRYTARLLGNRNADEVVIIDVTPAERRARQRHLFHAALESYAAEAFCPITVGGGIRTVDEVRHLIGNCCADKVVIGVEWLTGLHQGLTSAIVEKFGSQALVAAVNYRDSDDGALDGASVAQAVRLGIGEILLNSIDRDGSLMGYDLRNIRPICAVVDVPLMVAGGCGTWKHMAEAFEAGADAVCTSVIHHFTETSLAACKTWLAANCAAPVRAVA